MPILSYRRNALAIIIFLLFSMLFFAACSKSGGQVPKSLEDLLKRQGVKEMQVDLQYQSPDIPDKKYISLTVTYNFASAEGKLQKEFLGYIMKSDGNDWKI